MMGPVPGDSVNSVGAKSIPETLDAYGERREMVSARLDRLPATVYVWRLIILLSLGGFFELYDIYRTASISPGLIRAGPEQNTRGIDLVGSRRVRRRRSK